MKPIAAFRPSDWRKLEADLGSKATRDKLFERLVDFLKNTHADGGAASDELYLVATHLTEIQAWKKTPFETIVKVFETVPQKTRNAFYVGMPRNVADRLRLHFKPREPKSPGKGLPLLNTTSVVKGILAHEVTIVGVHSSERYLYPVIERTIVHTKAHAATAGLVIPEKSHEGREVVSPAPKRETEGKRLTK